MAPPVRARARLRPSAAAVAMPAPVTRVGVLAVLALAGLPGCSGAAVEPVPTSALSPVATAGVEAAHAGADVVFAQSMLALHQQERELAVLAVERSDDRGVRSLAAAALEDADEGERLVQLLTAWGAPVPGGMEGGTGTDAGSAPTEAVLLAADEVAGLAAAGDDEFDGLLLGLLAEQHRDAVALADLELADGRNPQALALAEELRAAHTEALTRVQELAADG